MNLNAITIHRSQHDAAVPTGPADPRPRTRHQRTFRPQPPPVRLRRPPTRRGVRR
jgi:hypothetical protein